jgi:hypothetical protein
MTPSKKDVITLNIEICEYITLLCKRDFAHGINIKDPDRGSLSWDVIIEESQSDKLWEKINPPWRQKKWTRN